MNDFVQKKALFIFSKYSVSENQAYLTNELVDEFSNRGIHSTVVSYSKQKKWFFERILGDRTEMFIGLNSSLKYFKYFIAFPVLFVAIMRILLRREKFEIMVMNAPVLVMFPVFILLPFLKTKRKCVIIFDFFPAHQVQAGAMPKFLETFLHWLESLLLRRFSKYGVMGVNNKSMAISYYGLCKKNVCITGIWGVKDKLSLKQFPNKNSDVIRMVFGGQLTSGRRLDLLINFLSDLRKDMLGKNICIDIYSDGKLCELYNNRYQFKSWINFYEPLDRNAYINNLPKYDFGLIVTDQNVSLPTLPSKVVDYINASINVIAMVEVECELRTKEYKSDQILLIPFVYNHSDILRVRESIIQLKFCERGYSDDFISMFDVKKTFEVLMS